MCIFAQPVLSVSGTKIFGRLDGQGNQFVAYQMEYATTEKNAMILTIPTKLGTSESSVQFVDLSGYDNFFKHLNNAFPAPVPPSMPLSRSGWVEPTDSALVVHKVGSFVASIVPQLSDFSRLDSQFQIAPETWAKIPLYRDYSFVVFQLEALDGKPHPMAFKFPTRHTEQVFFPTVHIHDGEVHSREKFDHTLYCQDPMLDKATGSYTNKKDDATGLTRSKQVAEKSVFIDKSRGVVAANQLLHRKRMRGMLKNADVFVSVRNENPLLGWSLPRAMQTPLALGTLGTASALGCTALPLAWILRRRAKLLAQKPIRQSAKDL